MKSILLILLAAVVLYFGLTSNTNKVIKFNNEEYKITRTEGTDGYYKYHYTKSGRDTSTTDFIEILKFDKPEFESDKEKGVAGFIKKAYKTKYVSGVSGQFGVFGPNNNKYAYTIRSETAESYLFVNYVLQSESFSSSEAKDMAVTYITNLQSLASELESQ
ncbi:hypothetical protein MNBD_GAMMA15-2231 [hydrothermal vent metagenome]|uniref:Uncharacterized protein n=1 Tax=hydrothermal vent metagenome TaxID=652676 RepID=A0A3B0YHD8_9ZZZZ